MGTRTNEGREGAGQLLTKGVAVEGHPVMDLTRIDHGGHASEIALFSAWLLVAPFAVVVPDHRTDEGAGRFQDAGAETIEPAGTHHQHPHRGRETASSASTDR